MFEDVSLHVCNMCVCLSVCLCLCARMCVCVRAHVLLCVYACVMTVFLFIHITDQECIFLVRLTTY